MSTNFTTDETEIKAKLEAFIQSGKLQDIFKDQENLAVIKLNGYSKALVLPYAQAVEFIKTLHQAQEIEVDWNNKIKFPETSELLDVSFKVIDEKRFNRAKIAHFLNIDNQALDTYLNCSEEEELPF